MSYNIDHIETKLLDASIAARDVVELIEAGGIPEDNFLDRMEKEADRAIEEGDPDRLIPIRKFIWTGEGSGHDYHEKLLPEVACCIRGKVHAIFYWEGGDSVSGLIIEDGEVEEAEVEMTIVRKVGE